MRKPFLLFYTIHFEYQTNEFYAFVTDFYRYCDNYSYVPSKSNAVILDNFVLYFARNLSKRNSLNGIACRKLTLAKPSSLKKNTTMYQIFEYLKHRIKAINIKRFNWIIAIDDDNNNNNDGNYVRQITSNKNSIAFRIWQWLLESFETVFCWIDHSCVLFQFSP